MAAKKATVVSVIGARPQLVKLAAISAALNRKFKHIVINSDQHYDYDLSSALFRNLNIPQPDFNLRAGSGDHGRQTGRILERCEKVLQNIRPNMVLVYGDTNTTLAGALAAAKLKIPLGHVEAGLRSHHRSMPEEINRVLTDRISDLLFYPTPTARRNLLAEGIRRGLVRSGDLTYELLAAKLPSQVQLGKTYRNFGLTADNYYLVTLHRAENVDDFDRLDRFVKILNRLEHTVLFLIHPRTMKMLKQFKLYAALQGNDQLVLRRPQPYLETLALISGARAVLTDSGGIQKEAVFLGQPCLTLRKETEWVETVAAGINSPVDMSWAKISRALRQKHPRRRKGKYKINGKKPSLIIAEAVDKYLRVGHER